MSRKYGEFIAMIWEGGNPPYELIYGHVTKEEAQPTLDHETGCPGVGWSLRHGWGRWVPARGREYDRRFLPCERARGAFPVTYCTAPGYWDYES